MKTRFLLFFCIGSFLTLTNCTDAKKSVPEPAPVVVEEKCRLLKVSMAYNGRPGTTDGGGQEYIYSGNRIVKQTDSSLPGIVKDYSVFEYDGAGRIITQKQYEQSNQAVYYARHDYIYNSSNRLISEKVYTQDQPGNLTYQGEINYSYDSNGRVDSLWRGSFVDTYEYDQIGNPIKIKQFEIHSNSTLELRSITEFLNYDSQRNPESLSTFSLRQLEPVTLSRKNNYQHKRTTQPGSSYFQESNYSFAYNAEGLVTERKDIGTNISQIYTYACD